MKVRIEPGFNPSQTGKLPFYTVYCRRHWWNLWKYLGTCMNLDEAKLLCNDILNSTETEERINCRIQICNDEAKSAQFNLFS